MGTTELGANHRLEILLETRLCSRLSLLAFAKSETSTTAHLTVVLLIG